MSNFLTEVLADNALIAFSGRNPEFTMLATRLDSETQANLLQAHRSNPELLKSLERIKQEDPNFVKDLSAMYKASPQAFNAVIARISNEPDAVLSDIKNGRGLTASPAAPAEGGAPAQPGSDTAKTPSDPDFDMRFDAQKGTAAPPSGGFDAWYADLIGLKNHAPSSPSTPSTPPAPSAGGGGGNDGGPLGGGLQDMFSKLAGFLQALPQILQALGDMFKQFFSGLTDSKKIQMDGNGGRDGPGADLANAGGVSQKVEAYAYGQPVPGAAPTGPGVSYRSQPQPDDPNLALTLRPHEAMS